MHPDKRKKDTVTLGEDPPDALGNTSATAETHKYSVYVTRSRKNVYTTMQATVFSMLMV